MEPEQPFGTARQKPHPETCAQRTSPRGSPIALGCRPSAGYVKDKHTSISILRSLGKTCCMFTDSWAVSEEVAVGSVYGVGW